VVHGYTTAFTISAVLLAAAMLVSLVMIRGGASPETGELDALTLKAELALAD